MEVDKINMLGNITNFTDLHMAFTHMTVQGFILTPCFSKV